ncbi:MAG: S8/S53 family peptidase [Deltaproteobacteria bacterium]|nr:S8/S53 family peptidase [Deltaproteobacteria bacterium]
MAKDEARVPAAVRQLASRHLGPEEHVIHSVTRVFPAGTVHRLVVFDAASGHTRKFDVTASGLRTEHADWVRLAKAAERPQRGALSAELYAAAQAPGNGALGVRVVHQVPDLALPRPTTADEAAWRSYFQAAASTMRPAADAVVKAITDAGGRVLSRGDGTPFIEAELTRGQLLGALRDHPMIERIELSKRTEKPKPHAYVSSVDLQLNTTFWWWGYNGTGVRVGVTGDDCLARNTYLWFPHQTARELHGCWSDADCRYRCADSKLGEELEGFPACHFPGPGGFCAGTHQTAVVGMIGHNAAEIALTRPRGAPFVDMYYANRTIDGHSANLDWLRWAGVTVVNESWGDGGVDHAAQDWNVRYGLTLVKSAGNWGASVAADCVATGVLCVGGYDTSIQFMFNKTSSQNPTACEGPGSGCDREVPDVALHANGVTTTDNDLSGGLRTTWGTSMAAGGASALVALLQQRWPSLFQYRPMPTRAALLASSCNTWEGAPYNRCSHDVDIPDSAKSYSDYRYPDERDGAGVPSAGRIADMVTRGRVLAEQTWWPSSFDPLQRTRVIGQYMFQQGDRVRAVLAWDGCPGAGAHADLDLRVLRNNYQVNEGGASYDNPYEIIEFVAPATDLYTFKAKYHTWNSCPGWGYEVKVGFAFDVVPPA